MKSDNKWMCELCFQYPQWREIGLIGNDHALIYDSDRDEYHILGGYGHNKDIVTTLKSKPYLNPDPKDLDESDEMIKKVLNWIDEADENFGNDWKMWPGYALNLYEACKEAGMLNEKEEFPLWGQWLFQFCAKLVERYND